MSRTANQIFEALAANRSKMRHIQAELKPLTMKLQAGEASAGEIERADNLARGGDKLIAEEKDLQAEFRDLVASGSISGEAGSEPGATDGPVNVGQGAGHLHEWTTAAIKALDGKTLRERGTHSVKVPVVGTILNAWPTDPLRETDADKRPHPTPRRVRFVTDLLATRPIDEDGVSYTRQTARTNNAAAVARHGAKPTSIYELTRVTDRARTIAHLSEPIAIQDLEDNMNLNGFIEDELILGLRLGLDAEVVSGPGTGESMSGLLTVITAEEAFDTDLTSTTRNAVTTLEETEVEPNAFLMSPATWQAIEEVKTTTGAYVLDVNQPVDIPNRRLHGIPVVTSNAMGSSVLLGDFSGARLAVRKDAQIDWATAGTVFDDPEYHDLFDHNQVKARAELRAVLEVTSIPRFLKVATSV